MKTLEQIQSERKAINDDLKLSREERTKLSAQQTSLLKEAGGVAGLVDGKLAEYTGRNDEMTANVDKITGLNTQLRVLDQEESEAKEALVVKNPLSAPRKTNGYRGFGTMLMEALTPFKLPDGRIDAGKFDALYGKDKSHFSAAIPGFDVRTMLAFNDKATADIQMGRMGAVNDLTTSTVATWPELTAPVVPVPIFAPKFQDYLPKIEANSEPVKFRQETTHDDNAAAVAEGSPLAQSDFATAAVSEDSAIIGTYYKLSEKLLADAAYMESWTNQQGLLRTLVALENALLAGNGTSNTLTGFYNRSLSNYSRLQDKDNNGRDQTNVDALVQGIDRCRVNGVCDPSLVVLHTSDYRAIRLLKNKFDQYIYGPPNDANDIRVLGTPMLATPRATLGEALTGDFTMYSALVNFPNMPLTMDISRVGNDRINLEWTLVIYLRAALLLYRLLAFSTISDLTH